MPAAQQAYDDPLKWRFQEQDGRCSEPRADTWENDLCQVKLLVMHRPTHWVELDKAGDYPYSWHLGGRKRLWELRMQLRFKRIPQAQMYFAVELGQYVPVSGLTRQAQKALVSACQKIVGDCYHSNGDDPNSTPPGGEVEAPTFAMPLWAFDQFEVSAPGTEPDLTGDFEGIGMCRKNNVNNYIKAMKDTLNNISTEHVYTFNLWGVSQFFDCVRWEITGGVLPVAMDFNRLCGAPPAFLTIYELSEKPGEKRHLASLKRSYFRVAAWSRMAPPPKAFLESGTIVASAATIVAPPKQAVESVDLLGDLFNSDPSPASATKPAAAAPQNQSVDLLDLLG
eukprot:TRINITY_DN108659_c0_g1_i1.p1 TRINITY_DN108659_c0_g1~~TRINITY_DN108659_c0_g1_i1.p1  ORF type:complete len:338 (-),score=76.70 TRINITY_DN108659_c0_g1_i1:170-1183(-)